jgi:signal transduction histidine kinase
MSERRFKWSLTLATLGVCLLPLLVQVGILFCLFQSYKQFDTYVNFQRSLRNVELLMAALTSAEEHALISFTRYRVTFHTRELEALHASLKDMQTAHDQMIEVAKPFPYLTEKLAPLLGTADSFSKEMEKVAEEDHKKDVSAGPTEMLAAEDFARLLREGMAVRAELGEAHVFSDADSDPTVAIQNSLMGLFVCATLLNLFVAGGVTVFYLRFVTKRLRHAKTNCEYVLTNAPLDEEPTNCVEFIELEESLAEAQRTLATMKQRRLAVCEGAPEVIFAVDQAVRVQMISDACSARWGYQPDFLMHKSITDIVHPSDINIPNDMLFQARQSGQSEGELRIRHRSGMFVQSRWSMKWNVSKSQAVVVSLDTTQDTLQKNMLVQQSEHQKMLIESLPVALLTASAVGTISGVSRQLYELFAERDNWVGANVQELLAGAARIPQWEQIRAAAEPVELLLREGREVPLSLEIRAHEFAVGDQNMYLVAFEDVSERYEVERFRQELVSMVSHDLRTPLTSVSAVLEMAQAGAYGNVDQPGIAAAKRAEWCASGLIQLINDLLDIERAKMRRIQLVAEHVSTNDLLNYVFSELEDLSYANGVELPPLDQPSGMVVVDSGRARQALKCVVEVLLQCGQAQSGMRLLTRDVDSEHFDIFIGVNISKLSDAEFQSMVNVYANRPAFDRTGNPFTRLHIACAESLLQLMGGTLQAMNVQGSLGFIIRLQKARAAVTV